METYKDKIRRLSSRIVDAQKPIRVLNAIKWEPSIEAEFFRNGARELPRAGPEYYNTIGLDFEARTKDAELSTLGNDIKRELGPEDELGRLMSSIVEEYRQVVAMLDARGTPEFYRLSRLLYGSPRDVFYATGTTVLDQGQLLKRILPKLEEKFLGADYPLNLTAKQVVAELEYRFSTSFLAGKIDVVLSDGIIADASAGADVIKIKETSMFSKKDIDILEVHEGWVHVATSANGKNQTTAKFLSKGPPRCVASQEGLAILMEILTFSTYPRRARVINDRVLAIAMAEDGADFLDVYRHQLTEGHSEPEAFRNATRVFRGGVIGGGAPFTKDISYCQGFIENYNFIRTAIRHGHPEIIRFMFAGKLHVDDVPLLYSLYKDGIVDAPALLPPHFDDVSGLSVWMSFSNFLATMDIDLVQDHFGKLFRKFL